MNRHSLLETLGGNTAFITSESGVMQNPMTMNGDKARRANGVTASAANENKIQDVWQSNLWTAISEINEISKKYNYIAMDTEYPGVVFKHTGPFVSVSDYIYKQVKPNVDALQLIQLGLTFFDEHGNLPDGPYTTWQFNFKFSLKKDLYAQSSISLLTKACIQFEKHENEGIDALQFSQLFTSTRLVLSDNIYWITFQGDFDFGYLMKILINNVLPNTDREFLFLFHLYFQKVYDIKYLMKSCKYLQGGLQKIANQLQLQRIGLHHQAGSDSLLTGMVFFKIREMYFNGVVNEEQYLGRITGFVPYMIASGGQFVGY